jgi:hypothetical protein
MGPVVSMDTGFDALVVSLFVIIVLIISVLHLSRDT